MRKIAAIAWLNLIRMFRDRANLFFVFVFPLLIIAVLGTQFADDGPPQVGISGGDALTERAVDRLEDAGAVEVRRVSSEQELTDLVSDGVLPLGAAIPDDASEAVQDGQPLPVTLVLGAGDDVGQLERIVSQAFAAEAVVPGVTADLAAATGVPAAEVGEVVSAMDGVMPPVEVASTTTTGAEEAADYGSDQIAVGMLLLMVFLNTLTASASLITSRRLGVSRRMLGTPTTTRTVIVGEGAGRWLIGMFQGVYIIVATTVIFGVQWGHLPTVLAIVAMFSAVAAGGAMLVGALMSNDAQASGITVMLGLALGALGGSMLPLDLFSSTMRTVAHATPHAWALDAFAQMTRHGATLPDVLPQLGVLAGFAAVLIMVASWRLRVTLTRS